MLWGLSGRVELTEYPANWSQADRLMARRGEGRLLLLPWALYARWSFSNGRIIANPGPSFFSGRETLAGDDVNLPTIRTQSTDPFSYYIDDLLSRPRKVRRVGHLLAPLDVRFIAWTTDADFREYRMLNRAPDLRLVYEGEELTLFENRVWRGETLALRNGEFVARPSVLFGTPRRSSGRRTTSPRLRARFPPGRKWARGRPSSSAPADDAPTAGASATSMRVATWAPWPRSVRRGPRRSCGGRSRAR